MCAAFGLVIALVEVAFPHKFSTILELDYDTPYDRHIIIEESHDTKYKRPSLEEPSIRNFGSKIFRRLSKRQNNSLRINGNDTKFGLDNPSMEIDPPKSPWRYPHRTFSTNRPTARSESRKSTKSVGFRDINVYGKTLHPSSAALGPSLDTSEVETIPDVHSITPEPTPIIKTTITEPVWESDTPVSSEDEGDQLERVQDIVVNPANFRAAASRQNSHDSRFSRNSSLRQRECGEDDWNEPERTSIVSIIKSALHMSPSSTTTVSAPSTSTTGDSGLSTPMRRISNEEADAIQLDRSGSFHQRSSLATVSARISAAVEADRSRYTYSLNFELIILV